MACSLKDLLTVQRLWNERLIPKKPRIMELGSNDLNVQDASGVEKLIAQLGGNPQKYPWRQNTVVPARKFYDSLDWEYYCLDIDNRPGTLAIDLNAGNIPDEFSDYFDLVTNHGTTEHVCNPIGSFYCIHEMTKPGGYMIHDTPIFGLGNHGFVNLTPKFWHGLIVFNQYKCLSAEVRDVPFDPKLIDPANFYLPEYSFIRNLETFSKSGQIINIIFQKIGTQKFLPPTDLWPQMSDEQMAKTLYYAATSISSITAKQKLNIAETVNLFLKSQRPCTQVKLQSIDAKVKIVQKKKFYARIKNLLWNRGI